MEENHISKIIPSMQNISRVLDELNAEKGTINIPERFKRLMEGNDLKTSYLCALNADVRSALEEEFVKWVEQNRLINWD